MTDRAPAVPLTDLVFVLIPAVLAMTYWVVTFGV